MAPIIDPTFPNPYQPRGICPNAPGPCACNGACFGIRFVQSPFIPPRQVWFVDTNDGHGVVRTRITNIGIALRPEDV